MGPLTSVLHRDRVMAYVRTAVEQGDEILAGGMAPADPALAAGCYVLPTVVRAKPSDRVAQEEVFGPFVTVLTFETDDEALAIANGT
ncbi:aldehyde dehydrogenase family protein, partial [Acinetobacter baumannii]